MACNALGLEFGSAAQLSERPGSMWNCPWGHALKRSPGINRKSMVSYPGPGFLSSAKWSPLPKKHYNGLNQTKPNITTCNYSNPSTVCTFCTCRCQFIFIVNFVLGEVVLGMNSSPYYHSFNIVYLANDFSLCISVTLSIQFNDLSK